MANKTISLPDDVIPIIDDLDVPFSAWVADQLRHYAAAQTGLSLGHEILADAALTDADRPTEAETRASGERMERSAKW